MDKSPDAFRTIGEVSEWLKTPTHVLRYWESRFSQLKPIKRAGGRRYYRPNDMLLLGGIKRLLHEDGLSIKGVQKMLGHDGVKSVAALSQPLMPVSVSSPTSDIPPAPGTTEIADEDERPEETGRVSGTGEPTEVPVAAASEIPPVDVPDDPPDDYLAGSPAPVAALLLAGSRDVLAGRRDAIIPIYRRLKSLHDRLAASNEG